MKNAGVVLSILMAAIPTAKAEQPSARTLLEVIDVNRDVVPAGTPAAFKAAFGPAPRNEAPRNVDGSTFVFVPLALVPVVDGKVALISTGSNECNSHTCFGLNSVHYLQGDKAGYEVDGEWLNVGASGAFGNPAQRWGWSDAITDVPVLYTEGGGVWQGHACSYAALTALTPTGPVEIASIPPTSPIKGRAATAAPHWKAR